MNQFKFNRQLTPWGKGFLTSVLGTTVSILLTFGTSALIDNKMKADVQRQTAMMVIHDIDVCVKQIEEMADDEEKRNQAIQYVLAHRDQIASLPEDTLSLAMHMLAEYYERPAIFDNAKENIFKSSQEIWGNLDNMAFIDNMERFYRERKEVENILKTDPVFVPPISLLEFHQLRINSTANAHTLDMASILKEKLKEPRVIYCIDFSANRTRFYREYAQQWRDISDRNKFIMNISDEELAEYIKNSQRSGSSVGKSEMTGQWERQSSGHIHIYYEFLETDSFRKKLVNYMAYPIWNGDIVTINTYGGTWRIKDDTLFMVSNPQSVEVQVDTTHISYRPEMRDSVKTIIREYLDVKYLKEEIQKSIKNNIRDTLPVTTNKANDKIEVRWTSSGDAVTTYYLKRVKQ